MVFPDPAAGVRHQRVREQEEGPRQRPTHMQAPVLPFEGGASACSEPIGPRAGRGREAPGEAAERAGDPEG